MKRIRAKYEGSCRWCGTRVMAGEEVLWERGAGIGHVNCAPSDDPAADSEYYAGRADGERYRIEREVYGPELADRFAMQDELNRWNWGDDY